MAGSKPVASENDLMCGACNKLKNRKNYYKSYNPIHVSGYIPFCKECLKKMSINTNGEIDLDKLKEMLRMIDKPFIYSMFQASVEDNKDTIGVYIKNLALNHKYDTWNDSLFEPKDVIVQEDSKEQSKFIVSSEIINKWGFGYQPEMYEAFERKYTKLINNYGEKTALHTENLLTYIRFRVQEEMATAKNDVKGAKEWASLASAAAQSAKINVSQLSKSDISGGIDVMSQLFEAVESEVGIIPLLPRVMEQPYDDADMIIWASINYNRRLEDKPRVEYRDIWKFYDEMLEEHFKQQGYDKSQIKQFKEKRNNVFRDLGEIYKEPLYEGND